MRATNIFGYTKDLLFKLFKKVQNFFSTPNRKIFLFYFLIFFGGAVLLWIPLSQVKGTPNIDFIDALFTSASAFSDTGLSVFNSTFETFNVFGQFIIFCLIIVGGLGLFTLKIFIISFFVKKFSYRNYEVAHSEMEFKSQTSSVKMIRAAFFVTISLVLVFGFTLGIIFATSPATNPTPGVSFNDPYQDWAKSFWMGFFTAASSINNAGFDITSSASFSVYSGNIFLQIILLVLFVVGGIGFPLIYESSAWINAKRKNKAYRFSLSSKVLLISYVFVALFGLSLTFLIEGFASINNSDSFFRTDAISLTTGQRVWALIFNTFSTRSAGFSTIDLNLLTDSTLFVYITLMFIGAGSSSTTGGIRTTTFWLLLVFMFGFIRERKEAHMFKRRINRERTLQAFVIFFFSLFLIIGASILMFMFVVIYGESYNMFSLLFLATSAFGAVGLATTSLVGANPWIKIILMLLMFIGQLGISNTLKQFKSRKRKYYKRYPEEDLTLG